MEATETDSADFPSPSDRIKQLNDIDKDVIKLLHAAGTAVKALTPMSEDSNQQAAMTQEAREKALLAPSEEYLFLLDSIRTRVRRQIMALEEAGIIGVESASRTGPSTTQPRASLGLSQASGESRGVSEGGNLGNLDVSWLNARNDRIGDKKAADLRGEAEALVQRVGARAEIPATGNSNEQMETS